MNDLLKLYLENRKDHTFIIPIGLSGSGKSSILTAFWNAIDQSETFDFEFNSMDDSADALRESYLQDFQVHKELPILTDGVDELNSFLATDGFISRVGGDFWKISYFDFSGRDFKALKKLVKKDEPESKSDNKQKGGGGGISVKRHREVSKQAIPPQGEHPIPIHKVLFGNLLDDLFSQLKSPFYLFLVADISRDADLQDRFFSRFLEFIGESERSDLNGVLLFLNKWDLRKSDEGFNEFVKNSYSRTFTEFLSLKKLGITVKIFPFSIGKVSEDEPGVLMTTDSAYVLNFLKFFEEQILSRISPAT